MNVKSFYCFLALLIFVSITSFAQNKYINNTEYVLNIENNEITFNVDLLDADKIQQTFLFVREGQSGEFQTREMNFKNNNAEYSYFYSNDISFVDFYVKVVLKDKTVETFPFGAPEVAEPLRINITKAKSKSNEVIFVSPESNSVVNSKNLFVTISLFNIAHKVDIHKSELIVNDLDVSDKLVVAGDFLIFDPSNFDVDFGTGRTRVTLILYDSEGNKYNSYTSSFFIDNKIVSEDRLTYNLDIDGESRNESFSGNSTWYNNLGLRFNGDYKDWTIRSRVYATSEEKSHLQPKNRYSASIENDWLKIQLGDVYPRINNLILNGKRVRGFSGELDVGFFNLKTSYGQIRRSVEGELLNLYNKQNAPLASNVIRIDSAKYGDSFGEVDFGTHSRDIFVVKPTFSFARNVKFGLSYLHSKDDESSIDFGSAPRENAVFGTDLFIGLDDRRIEITGEAAFSIYNNDIRGGNFSNAQIDSAFGEGSFVDAEQSTIDFIKDVKDVLGSIITVNQYIGPLNPQELSTFAGEAAIKLNYLGNRLKTKYIYRGNDYQSFGQTFLRTDVKGISIQDRILLFKNRLHVNVGLENLEDNLQENKLATTDYKTYNAYVSYYPKIDFPNVSVGYTKYVNKNDLDVKDTLNYNSAIDDQTDRYSFRISYDLNTKTHHRLSAGISASNKEDNTLRNSTGENRSYSLSVRSKWSSVFRTSFRFSNNSTLLNDVEYSYSTVSVSGKYLMMDNKMELAADIAPTFGDLERQLIDLSLNYDIMKNFALMLKMRLYRIPDYDTNTIYSLAFNYQM